MNLDFTGFFKLFSLQNILALIGGFAIFYYMVGRTRRFFRDHGRRIIDGIFWILNRVASRWISGKLSMRHYCRNQLGNDSSRFLQVPGIKGTTLDVDRVFVPVNLESNREQTFSSSNLFDAGNRLVVVGDPGSGKSTLVKRVFRDACRRSMKDPQNGRIPIRLELKTLSPPDFENEGEAGVWLFDHIKNFVTEVEGFQMEQLFNSYSSGTGLLVMLDGLDEVASERYTSVITALKELSRKLSSLSEENVIVLTMRIQFHQQIRHDLVDSFPQTLYVRSFLPSEIYLFLNRWPFERGSYSRANRIYTDLTDRPTLREMCSNPLVLAMYVVNHLESGSAEIPETRTEFYRKVIDELLVMRRRRQDLVSGRAQSLRDQRVSFLGKLAFENLIDPSQPANSLSWKKAIDAAKATWSCDDLEAESRFRELASETGIIGEERPGETFRFIHLTFCEFLAAMECTNWRLSGWDSLLQKHREFSSSDELQLQSRLIEVVPFAFALLQPVMRPEALANVFSMGDREVLGRCFLETQMYQTDEWASYFLAEQKFLSEETESDWSEDKLRRLHLFSVIIRDAREWYSNIARIPYSVNLDETFSLIVSGSKEKLLKVFISYASQDAASAFRLASQVGIDMLSEHPEVLVESCQEASFLAIAISRFISDDKNRDAWAHILIEAAVRYVNVAYQINMTPMPPARILAENKYNKDILKLFSWRALKRNSCYAGAMQIVLESKSDLPNLPNLKYVREAAQSASFGTIIISLFYPLLAAIFFTPMSVLIVLEFYFPNAFIARAVAFSLSGVSGLLGFMMMSYMLAFRALYGTIFNLHLLTFRFLGDGDRLQGGTLFRYIFMQQGAVFVRLLLPSQLEILDSLEEWRSIAVSFIFKPSPRIGRRRK
ncbi:NACHT domain-containing protein [Streptosporangium amethystogenes]|uniref:NACHT domain-containing protein n=1 Tax=Streptosporangium amethystogenes TaxID=2002 RepID=UPI00378AE9D6